jgi:hypothetical protein
MISTFVYFVDRVPIWGTHVLKTMMHTTMHIVVANVRRRMKPTKDFGKNYTSAQDLVFFRTFFWRKT